MEASAFYSDHTFVILAYEESEFLPECIASVLAQTAKSNVVIATATDNTYIRAQAAANGIDVIVNHNHIGMAEDFDFAIHAAATKYVTIAHQDDVYSPDYLKKVHTQLDDHTIIAFSDYCEGRTDGIQNSNRNLRIKRIMLSPLLFKPFQKSKWVRRRILSFGDPICCPAVTFCRDNIPDSVFSGEFRCDMDWKAWTLLSKQTGRFVFVPEILMMHRVHKDSTTVKTIQENRRTAEDFEILKSFWPEWIAAVIARLYANSEKQNKQL